ncbi:PPC domain-containing protein [Halomicroarcula sp. GCM10025817]|uniref:PPC domain-containing protein n=1 Tax=Haloarcula TaxID=2237 RepID=UPI0023E8CDFA|nr:PPC domain-containing protein [Halomicroarcula sp. SYNS111]
MEQIKIIDQPARGEIDQQDPQVNDNHFEPVTLSGQKGTTVVVTMESESGDPYMEFVAPNGTVVASNEDYWQRNDSARVNVTLPVNGEYTIRAMSTEPGETFEYWLTVSEWVHPNDRGWFAGEMQKWNESERYAEFTADYQELASDDAVTIRPTRGIDAVNPVQDYAVVTYHLSSDDPSPRELMDIDTSLLISYTIMLDDYRTEYEQVNESWVPDRIYHRAMTPNGTLYRTTYITKEWADTYDLEDEITGYWFMYLSTEIEGPASPSYVEGGENSTTRLTYPEMNRSEERAPP